MTLVSTTSMTATYLCCDAFLHLLQCLWFAAAVQAAEHIIRCAWRKQRSGLEQHAVGRFFHDQPSARPPIVAPANLRRQDKLALGGKGGRGSCGGSHWNLRCW